AGVSRALHRFELLGHQLQVQNHVVQRILALVRKADGDALEEADPIGGMPLEVLLGLRGNARNRIPHSWRLAASGAQSCSSAKTRNFPSGGVFTAQRYRRQGEVGALKRARGAPARPPHVMMSTSLRNDVVGRRRSGPARYDRAAVEQQRESD